MIRFILGLLLVMGAVGGMDDPQLADHFLAQIGAAVLGLLIMFWGGQSLDKDSDDLYN